MPVFLLDTNTVSRILRNDSEILRRRYVAERPSHLAISVITQAELLYGLAKKPTATRLRAKVESFLERVRSLAWSPNFASHYATLREKSEAEGLSCGAFDLLIAAQAYATGMVLVTGDTGLHRLAPWLAVRDWTRD